MQKSTAPNTSTDSVGADAPPAGDADAVEKTTYVVGKGTDDRARHAESEVSGAGPVTSAPDTPPLRVPDDRG